LHDPKKLTLLARLQPQETLPQIGQPLICGW
jgi:hypothetical protein